MSWLRRARSHGRHVTGGVRLGRPEQVALPRQRWLPPEFEPVAREPAAREPVGPAPAPPVLVRLAFQDGTALALGPDEPLAQALADLADELSNRSPGP